jgi:hypothetical protein
MLAPLCSRNQATKAKAMSNEDMHVTAYGGGVTRVQWGVEDDSNAPGAGVPYAKDGTVHTFDSSTGGVESARIGRVSGEEIRREVHGAGILGTANEMTLRPTTVVDVNGVGMELQMAERLGYVTRDASGRYTEVGGAQRQASQQALHQHRQQTQLQLQRTAEPGDINGMKAEPFPQEVEAELAKLADGVQPQAVGEVFMGALFDMWRGNPPNVEAVVSKTGLPHERAAELMVKGLSALDAQAGVALKEMQIDPAQFVEWALREKPEALRQATVNHVGVRSLQGYRDLGKEFLRSTTPSEAGLKQAGYDTRVEGKDLMVLYQGQWISARAAALQGLI